MKRIGVLLTLAACSVALADSWPMKQRDMGRTGRASFSVPASRMNGSFFDALLWQKKTPNSPGEGNLGATTMAFFDGVGPNGQDVVAAGYHWPKGVQGMNRHTGKRFWAADPSGGETIGELTPAFSLDGSVTYVGNDATDHTATMAFYTATGPSAWWGGDPADRLVGGNPTIAPDGRIFRVRWEDRMYGGKDTLTSIQVTWTAATQSGPDNVDAVAYDYPGQGLRIITSGRWGTIKSFNGASGAEVWSVASGHGGTDITPTIDPQTGNVYCAYAITAKTWVAGLDRDGNPLWGTAASQVYTWPDGTNIYGWATTGCLSHDGATYYVHLSTNKDVGPPDSQLLAVNTSDGTLKWAFDTQGAGTEAQLSCPIITPNNVIIVGSNYGAAYYAVRDDRWSATLLDTLVVDTGNGSAARASATLSAGGTLYLPARLTWTTTSGDSETPDSTVQNLYNAFDLTGPGVCCVSGACSLQTQVDCAGQSGTWYGQWDDCTNHCSPVPGACCFADGQCISALEDACALQNGLSLGSSTSCQTVACPQPGACCLPDGSCTDAVAEFACQGIFVGAGVPCASSPCPGACCLADLSCQNTSEGACATANGLFMGFGSDCQSTSCPQNGACCLLNGSCLDTPPWACTLQGGLASPSGTECQFTACPPTAYCCLPIGCIVTYGDLCTQQGGVRGPDNSTCADAPCPPAAGACCVHSSCMDNMTQTDCTAAGGVFQGGGSTCSPTNPCPPCAGDADCSGRVNFDDINYFVAALAGGQAGWEQFYASQNAGQPPPCPYLNSDVNGDTRVTFDDIPPFVDKLVAAAECP